MTTLVIVESPNKVAKIGAILGDKYKVMASVGHVRDLPTKEMGIETPMFNLTYQPTDRGKSVLSKLKTAVAQADRVLLATDPDREGEAIAWHLADALNLKHAERVTFTAITKEKILAAFTAPRPLDMQRVHAQEARRALDRIIGYRVSSALSSATGQRLGAGRVQSPAVRLVVDRERAIAAFKVTQHYGAELIFNNNGTTWKAQWDTKPHLPELENYLLNMELAELAAAVRHLVISEYEDNEIGKAPPAPFTTATLQQIAGQRFKIKPKRTMELAQRLYEQGAITYHRTDTPNIDDEGYTDIVAYAESEGLPLANKQRKWKSKEGAQEGHEAIRPTYVSNLVCGENDDERALYRLIWQYAVASQLADATYAVRTVRLIGDANGTSVSFKATGRTLVKQGWQVIYADSVEGVVQQSDDKDSNNPIPVMAVEEALVATDGCILAKKTKPPTRFTEPTLVAEMERLGIGRPSTYAAILDNISTREYILADKNGYLVPSSLGEIVRDGLVNRFEFVDLNYTRELEDQLDQIAEGKANYIDVVSAAWAALDVELNKLRAADLPCEYPCPTCKQSLHRIKGKYGYFWACSDRECKTNLLDAKGQPGERKTPPTLTGIACPKCGKELARRVGMSKPIKHGMKSRSYDFYSCTGFPKCDAKYSTGADGKPVL
ncbi:MAG: type I DNA topoisomerase [Gammaproteobacteria bacterium]